MRPSRNVGEWLRGGDDPGDSVWRALRSSSSHVTSGPGGNLLLGIVVIDRQAPSRIGSPLFEAPRDCRRCRCRSTGSRWTSTRGTSNSDDADTGKWAALVARTCATDWTSSCCAPSRMRFQVRRRTRVSSSLWQLLAQLFDGAHGAREHASARACCHPERRRRVRQPRAGCLPHEQTRSAEEPPSTSRHAIVRRRPVTIDPCEGCTSSQGLGLESRPRRVRDGSVSSSWTSTAHWSHRR